MEEQKRTKRPYKRRDASQKVAAKGKFKPALTPIDDMIKSQPSSVQSSGVKSDQEQQTPSSGSLQDLATPSPRAGGFQIGSINGVTQMRPLLVTPDMSLGAMGALAEAGNTPGVTIKVDWSSEKQTVTAPSEQRQTTNLAANAPILNTTNTSNLNIEANSDDDVAALELDPGKKRRYPFGAEAALRLHAPTVDDKLRRHEQSIIDFKIIMADLTHDMQEQLRKVEQDMDGLRTTSSLAWEHQEEFNNQLEASVRHCSDDLKIQDMSQDEKRA